MRQADRVPQRAESYFFFFRLSTSSFVGRILEFLSRPFVASRAMYSWKATARRRSNLLRWLLSHVLIDEVRLGSLRTVRIRYEFCPKT